MIWQLLLALFQLISRALQTAEAVFVSVLGLCRADRKSVV